MALPDCSIALDFQTMMREWRYTEDDLTVGEMISSTAGSDCWAISTLERGELEWDVRHNDYARHALGLGFADRVPYRDLVSSPDTVANALGNLDAIRLYAWGRDPHYMEINFRTGGISFRGSAIYVEHFPHTVSRRRIIVGP